MLSVDVRVGFLAPGNVEVLAAGCAGADENRVVVLVENRLEAGDFVAELRVDAEIDDAVDFLVEHRRRQAERRNVGAHQAAAGRVLLVERDVVAERQQIARHRQRRRAGAEERDMLAVLFRRHHRHHAIDIALVVGGDTLQAADRDGLFLDAHAPAGRFARAVADAAENAGKDVALPIEHVGLGILAACDQADVFGHRRVCRAGVLAVDDFVKILRIGDVRRLHAVAPAAGTIENAGWRSFYL